MEQLESTEGWDVQKSRLKQKLASLTSNSQLLEDGKKEELFQKLSVKFGKTREEFDRIVDGL